MIIHNHFPLLNETASYHNETIYINIDGERFIFMDDHQFNEENIMPGTFIMELLIEAAAYKAEVQLSLMEKLHAQEVRNFVIARALSVDRENPAQLEIHPVLKSSEKGLYLLEVTLKCQRINKKGKVLGIRTMASAEVLLSEKKAFSPLFSGTEGEDFTWYDFSSCLKDYYDFFHSSHGPLFQSITGRFALSDSSLIGEYDCGGREKDFIFNQNSVFMTSPLGNDSTLQYGVMLAITEKLKGHLPVGGDSLSFYETHPVSGPCYVYVEKLSIDESLMVCNISSFNSRGEIFMRAENFRLQKAPYSIYNEEVMNKLLTQYRCKKPLFSHGGSIDE